MNKIVKVNLYDTFTRSQFIRIVCRRKWFPFNFLAQYIQTKLERRKCVNKEFKVQRSQTTFGCSSSSMAGALGTAVREIRIHLCQKSTASKGVREWVEKQYVPLKKANPNFPILIRECANVTPKVFARYALGRESSVVLSNKSAADVGKAIESLAKS